MGVLIVSTASAVRRAITLGVAITVVAAALVSVGAVAAEATNVANAAKVFASLNSYRTAHSLPTFVQNRYLTAYAQGWVQALAKCDTPAINLNTAAGCADSAPETNYAPSGSTFSTQIYGRLTGSNLEARLATYLTTNFAAQLQGGYNYVGVGFYVKGSIGFVDAQMFHYTNLPFAHYGKVSITSHPVVGVPIKAHFSGFSPAPESYQYVWYSNDIAVASDQPTYTPVGSDYGHAIKLVANALKPGYVSQNNLTSPHVHSVALGTLRVPTSPKLRTTGLRNVGQFLYFSVGPWVPSPSVDVQWLRNGKPIVGQTADSYQLMPIDKGTHIDVRESVHLTGYHSRSIRTRNAAKIGAPLLPSAPTPSFFGTLVYGHVLTADLEGTWGPAPVHISYAWTLNGKKVSNADKSTFTLPASAVNKSVAVVVTGTKAGYAATVRTSTTGFVIAESFLTVGIPSISGGHAVGNTLNAGHGFWSPTPTSYTYNWYRNGAQLSGAHTQTYQLKSVDLGQFLQVEVVAHRSGYFAVHTFAGVTIS
ncbi:MAG: hypothetical protein JWQ39_998 [Glaciihabitans sp.]|nr:hypothetical protein [Glaciihabitans sp.]